MAVKKIFSFLPEWLDINVIVPAAATVVVIIVGIVVICVALSRRAGGPETTRLRGISSADEKYYEGQCILFFTIIQLHYTSKQRVAIRLKKRKIGKFIIWL